MLGQRDRMWVPVKDPLAYSTMHCEGRPAQGIPCLLMLPARKCRLSSHGRLCIRCVSPCSHSVVTSLDTVTELLQPAMQLLHMSQGHGAVNSLLVAGRLAQHPCNLSELLCSLACTVMCTAQPILCKDQHSYMHSNILWCRCNLNHRQAQGRRCAWQPAW